MLVPKALMSEAVLCQASRSSLCCRRCPHHRGGFQTSPAHRDSSQLSLGAQFPQPITSSTPQSHSFTFCLLLICFASTMQMNLSTDYNIPPSSTSRAHRMYFFFSLHRQNISFAPKMRSAETQKMSKNCHGLLVQLNWRRIRANKPFQGSGKCFVSPPCSFSPASGIHKFYPDGEKKIAIHFIIYVFVKGSFHIFGSGSLEAWIIKGSRFSSYPCLQGRFCDKNKVSVQYR